jgi:hypothetical protein
MQWIPIDFPVMNGNSEPEGVVFSFFDQNPRCSAVHAAEF